MYIYFFIKIYLIKYNILVTKIIHKNFFIFNFFIKKSKKIILKKKSFH